MSPGKPVFVIAPGAAYNPAHYGLLMHHFLTAGYGAVSSCLPSLGTLHSAGVSVEDDSNYIRDHLVLPILENEERDVIIVGHSYSSLPASHAVTGLDSASRKSAGKKASVLGQIYIAGIISKGGDGNSLVAAFGGALPPHVQAEESTNLVRCADPIPPLMADVDQTIALAASRSTVCPSLTSFQSPVPRASWDAEGYKDRIAYVKTLSDAAVPTQVQDMMLQESGVAWKTGEIDSSHSPMLVKAEELAEIMIGFAKQFEAA